MKNLLIVPLLIILFFNYGCHSSFEEKDIACSIKEVHGLFSYYTSLSINGISSENDKVNFHCSAGFIHFNDAKVSADDLIETSKGYTPLSKIHEECRISGSEMIFTNEKGDRIEVYEPNNNNSTSNTIDLDSINFVWLLNDSMETATFTLLVNDQVIRSIKDAPCKEEFEKVQNNDAPFGWTKDIFD